MLRSSKGCVEKPNSANLVFTADKWLVIAVAEYLFVYKNWRYAMSIKGEMLFTCTCIKTVKAINKRSILL